MNIEKELKELKDRLSKIESSQKKSGLFGSSYSNSGSTSSDYLIKTKGKVKIQIGNKFIDLIKDGKINVDSSFIFKQDSVGSRDGIYVTGSGEDTKTTLVVGGEQIELQGELGNTYVSFQAAQETTGEQKYQALTNIGFIQKDKTSIDTSLQNGIIYIESEKKLYTVINGQLSEYRIEFPIPYTKQFVLAKDTEDEGSLLIQGTGSTNGIKFDNLIIYSENNGGYFNASGKYLFNINDSNILQLSLEGLTCYKPILSNKITSQSASDTSGFRLYATETESTLEVDNIIVRNGIEANCIPYPEYYSGNINSIEAIQEDNIDENTIKVSLSLRYKNTYEVGDAIILFDKQKVTDQNIEETITLTPFEATITEVDDQTISFETSESYRGFCEFVFLKEGIHVNPNKLELIDDTGVNTVVGDISAYKMKNKGQEESISGNGVYSSNSVFDKAQYSSNYHLDSNDNSSRFASTEWVLQNIVPTGTIVMFSGLASNIPSGWHICDGTEGTPNLIGKFIKASNTSGETGGQSSIQILEENMPKHTHTFVGNQVTTSESGAHTHTIRGKYGKSDNANDRDCLETGSETDMITTSQSGAHTHTIDMSATQLSYQGGGKPIEFEPLYYSLIYIMKTS